MRKTVVIVLLCVLCVPMMVRGQEESLWELTQVATVDELGIQFNIPDGWVTNGFIFAENPDDLEALTDTEAATQPVGFVILIYGLPLTSTEDGMPSVEQAVDGFLLSSSGNISSYQYGVVNLRPSISLSFIGSEATAINLFTFWVQDDTFVSLQLITPDQTVNTQLTSTWEQVSASVRPILPEDFEFADEPYEVNELGFSIVYPEGWAFHDADEVIGFPGVIFSQYESDAARELPTGVVISLMQDLNGRFTGSLEDEVTPNEFTEAVSRIFEEPVHWEGEFNLFGQRGVAVNSTWACCDASDHVTVYYYFSLFIHDQTLDTDLWFQLTAPNEDLYNQYLPVFFAMLQSIQPLES